MKKPTMPLLGAGILLIATAIACLAFHQPWIAGVAGVAVALVLVGWLTITRRQFPGGPTLWVGTVCAISNDDSATAAGERQIMIEVASVHEGTFIGRLIHRDGDPDMSMLRPGLVVLVAFDPAAREELSLPTDVEAMLAVRAKCVDPI